MLIDGLNEQQMAKKMYEDIYRLMPPALNETDKINFCKKIIELLLVERIEGCLWKTKKFFFWDKVLFHIKNY